MKKIRKAFTLIEMVIVLFIISLLLLIMIPNLAKQKEHATNRSDEAFRTTLKTQTELYLENNDDDKTITKVTLNDLKNANYITSSQAKRAQEMQDKIESEDNLLDKLKDKDNINAN